jgi:Leucine-rich repeat (LRR) protein
MTMTALKPKSRWFQFSLRTLLLLMLVACIGLGWVAMKKRQGEREKAAVVAIEKLGGNVQWLMKSKPKWLTDLLGVEFFWTAVKVSFNYEQVNDSGLEYLKELPQLRILAVSDTQITDISLVRLNGLSQLGELYLDNTQVTDAGLQHLTGLSQLKFLHLRDTQVTDEGVKKLQHALPNCRIER